MTAARTTSRVVTVLAPCVTVAASIGLWALIKRVGNIPDYLLPSPLAVVEAFADDRTRFLSACGETALCAGAGFAIAAGVGVLAASVLSLLPVVERAVYPLTLLFQMVPLIAIAPLLAVWFGNGRPAIIASAAIVSVFPVIANTLSGLRSRDPALAELFRILGASPVSMWWKLALPASVPSIVTGLRIAAGLATIGTISGEFFAGIGGEGAPLGVLVTTDLRNFQTARIFSSVVRAACVGFALFGTVSVAGRLLLARWMRSA